MCEKFPNIEDMQDTMSTLLRTLLLLLIAGAGLKTVLENAKAEGKSAVFVDVFAIWCKPCHYMEDSVFTDAAVGDYYNRYFASVQLDAEAGEGIEFAAQHGVKAYPTLLLLDLDGQVIARREGALSPVQLVTWAGAAMASQQTEVKGGPRKTRGRHREVYPKFGRSRTNCSPSCTSVILSRNFGRPFSMR
jgi:thioredoxin-like negative regulator of GroEL